MKLLEKPINELKKILEELNSWEISARNHGAICGRFFFEGSPVEIRKEIPREASLKILKKCLDSFKS